MSVPVAVWNKIEALEQAHAELAAKVVSVACLIDDITDRLAALESPAPAPDPVCANCGHPSSDHKRGKYGPAICQVITRTHSGYESDEMCECRKFVPTAEPAPLDPVLVITVDFLEDGDGYLRTEIAGILRDALNRDEEVLGLDAAWRISTEVLAKILTYGRDGAR